MTFEQTLLALLGVIVVLAIMLVPFIRLGGGLGLKADKEDNDEYTDKKKEA